MPDSKSYRYQPTRYGSIRTPDLASDKDITLGRERPTPNQAFTREVAPGVVETTLILNSLDGGLGRTRGNLQSLINRTRGEYDTTPLDTRYVDSLHLPSVMRQSSTPALSITASSAPSFRADAIDSGTGTAVTATKPAGTADGDLVIIVLVHDDASTTVSAVPSGFSLIQTSDPGATGDFAMYSYQKIAASEGASWAFTLSASERWRCYTTAVQNPATSGVSDSAETYTSTATRFYMPSSGTAPITVTSSGWDVAAFETEIGSSSTPQGTAMTSQAYADSNDTNRNILLGQYVVTSALAAQTISAQTIKIQVRGFETSTARNLFLAWKVYVVSSDGGTVRGTLVALRRDGTELSSSGSGQNRGDSATSTEVTSQAGDYLVFEVGIGGDPDAGSDHDGNILIGDVASSDLPENDTETAAYNPWIEFANAITFQAGVSAVDLTATVITAESLVLSVGVVDEDARTFTGQTDSGESITEREDSAAVQISIGAYTESVTALGDVTHTITRSSGTTAIAGQIFVIPPAPYGKRMSHVNMFGYHVLAAGDGTLKRESQDTTPALESIAYDPPSPVNAIVPLIIGGATADQRAAILMTGDPGVLLEDFGTTPTVNGTAMEASSEPGWGIIQTSLFTNDILRYSNGAIYIGSRTGAINATFTSQLPNVPNGGAAIGEVWLPGADLRAYWMLPTEDCGTSQAETVGVPMKPVSTNLYGQEPQDLYVPLWATKNGVGKSYTTAAVWQQGILLTDGYSIVWHNGRNNIMNWPGERPGLGALGEMLCRGFWVKGVQLRILVERVGLHGGTGNTLFWIEEYDERTDTFHPVSRVVDSGSVGSIIGANAIGSFPVSAYSDICYWHDDTNWMAQIITDLTRNPAVHINGSTAAGQHWGFESSASWTSPEWLLGVPSVLSEVHYTGDPGNGVTDGSVEIEVATQSRTSMSFSNNLARTFNASDPWNKHSAAFPNNTDAVNRLQVRITGNRGASAFYTPQCVPVTLKWLSFLDGNVRSPLEVLGLGWLQQFD